MGVEFALFRTADTTRSIGKVSHPGPDAATASRRERFPSFHGGGPSLRMAATLMIRAWMPGAKRMPAAKTSRPPFT
jgi:hypothetical protein